MIGDWSVTNRNPALGGARPVIRPTTRGAPVTGRAVVEDERVTALEAILTVLVGLSAGLLSGLFGVGGGIVMTPGLTALAGVAPIVAVATPLPVILPTAAVGAFTYHRAGEVDLRAASWISLTGAAASAGGALLTEVIDARMLLVATAALLAWQSVQILRGTSSPLTGEELPIPAWTLALVGIGAGLLSGLLGIGGGLVIVPALAGILGVPLKRALGTSLVAVVVLVDPRDHRAHGARQHRLDRRVVPGDRLAPGSALRREGGIGHEGAHAPADGRELHGARRGRLRRPADRRDDQVTDRSRRVATLPGGPVQVVRSHRLVA